MSEIFDHELFVTTMTSFGLLVGFYLLCLVIQSFRTVFELMVVRPLHKVIEETSSHKLPSIVLILFLSVIVTITPAVAQKLEGHRAFYLAVIIGGILSFGIVSILAFKSFFESESIEGSINSVSSVVISLFLLLSVFVCWQFIFEGDASVFFEFEVAELILIFLTWGTAIIIILASFYFLKTSISLPIAMSHAEFSASEKGKGLSLKEAPVNNELKVLFDMIMKTLRKVEKQEKIEQSFETYVDEKVANEIRRQSDPSKRLEGMAIYGTVLFVDIRGFTRMSESNSPENVVKKLNEFFALMVDVVRKYDGVIDKFIGDNLMVTWGVPEPETTDQSKAILAGIGMLEANHAWNEGLPGEVQGKINIGIGICSGNLIAGSIGSKDRMDFTVIGDTVNTAQRIESIAGENQLLVSKSVKERAQLPVKFRELEPQKVKGKKDLVEVFEVVSIDENFIYRKT